VSYYARSATIVFDQVVLVPTSEKSIAGCQKQGRRLYAMNYKPGKRFLTHTNNSKFHRLSISLYMIYAYFGKGSNVD
jgi:hypothetical protein